MTNKNYGVKTVSVFLAVLVLIFASDCRAFSRLPDSSFSIYSEYVSMGDSASPNTRVWQVVPALTSNGRTSLRFSLGEIATGDAVCELEISSYDEEGEILWKGKGGRVEKRSTTGLLLIPGYPAPCDVLPLDEKNDGRLYQQRTEAGGSIFTRNYYVSAEVVSHGKALAEGWIRENTSAVTAGLIMITAVDEKGSLAARQLWPVDGNWWLYEETPLRRSWLIP